MLKSLVIEMSKKFALKTMNGRFIVDNVEAYDIHRFKIAPDKDTFLEFVYIRSNDFVITKQTFEIKPGFDDAGLSCWFIEFTHEESVKLQGTYTTKTKQISYGDIDLTGHSKLLPFNTVPISS